MGLFNWGKKKRARKAPKRRKRSTRASIARSVPKKSFKRVTPIRSFKTKQTKTGVKRVGRGRLSGVRAGNTTYFPSKDFTIKGLRRSKSKIRYKNRTWYQS